MTFGKVAEAGLDYMPCRYGTSRTTFRGPRKDLSQPYVAVMGGTETYGKFVADPYPELLERLSGTTTANFGCVNAGLDVFLNDDVVMRACADAALTVIQITGAQNMSNRFYTVHPRRNDRFLQASNLMQMIWPEVDFTEIHFTRHLLNTLRATSPERFARLRAELTEAWVARMLATIRHCNGRVVLLWMADRRPEDAADESLESAPLFVNRTMIEALRGEVRDIVEIVSPRPYSEIGTAGMVFAPLEEPAARALPGPDAHEAAARALAACVERFL